jgi:hypothetical protein
MNRNLLIGACSYALAMTGAFTNHLVPATNTWVKVKYTGETTFMCRNTSLRVCSNYVIDAHACKIIVADIQVATNAYADPNCSVILRDSGHGEGIFNPSQVIVEAPEFTDELP